MTAACTTTERTIRILLVDDNEAVRRALTRALSAEPDLEVIGEAGDGEHAIHLALTLHPDIILMDLKLPGMSGIDATRRITAAGAAGAVIMLTAFGGDETRVTAAKAGIALFLEKGDDLDDLAEKIRFLHDRNNPA